MTEKDIELRALGEELTKREDALMEDWLKAHKLSGRDGGPVQEIRKIRDEGRTRYGEIIQKYEAREGK